jgi:hypothetical protein
MDVPTIRQHDDVTPHSSEKDLAQRDAVTMIPAIAMEHEHRWPGCRKLDGSSGTYPSASMDTSEMTLWRTSSSDCSSHSTGVSFMFRTGRWSNKNAFILMLSGVVSSRSVYGIEKSVGTGTSSS